MVCEYPPTPPLAFMKGLDGRIFPLIGGRLQMFSTRTLTMLRNHRMKSGWSNFSTSAGRKSVQFGIPRITPAASSASIVDSYPSGSANGCCESRAVIGASRVWGTLVQEGVANPRPPFTSVPLVPWQHAVLVHDELPASRLPIFQTRRAVLFKCLQNTRCLLSTGSLSVSASSKVNLHIPSRLHVLRLRLYYRYVGSC